MNRPVSRGYRPSALRLPVMAWLGLAVLTGAVWAAPRESDASNAPVEKIDMDPRVAAIDVELTIDLDAGTLLVRGRLEIEASGASDLELTVNPWMTLERTSVAAGVVEHRKSDAGKYRLWLDPPVEGRRVVSFRMSGRPRRGSDYLVRPDRVVLGPSDGWYPMLRDTWADARVRVEVPEDWTVVAPGRRRTEPGSAVQEWRTERPVRTLAVVAAPGLVLTEDSVNRIPVRMAAPDRSRDASALALLLRDPIVWFTSTFERYRFDGFNLVLLPGLEYRVQAGGMLVAPVETTIESRADAADLIAGQWFGQRLAGDGAWIDAFAAWSATRYGRERARAVPAEIARLREEYFRLSRYSDVPLSRADALTPQAVVRGKGSAAPEMVRLIVGERRAGQAMRDLYAQPVGPPLSLADVRAVYEKHAGATLLRAFADWFDRKGAPEIEVELRSMASAADGWRADLTVSQRRGSYALPVEVLFVGRGGETRRQTVQIDEETTSVFYDLPFEPVRVELDPLGELFRRKSE